MNNIDATTNAHTPVTLMAVFTNAFKIEQDSSILWLKGVYQDRKRKSYGGYYYDRLKDELGGQIVTLKLPERIKHTIKHRGLYLFKGILDKDVRSDGVIEPVFIVTELAGQVASILPDGMNKRADIQRQKANVGYRDFDQAIKQKLYQGEQPRIALIFGATSIVLQDVTSALKGAGSNYDLVEHRVNLSNKEAIIDSFVRHDNGTFDAVAIVRVGGPGLEIFDDVEIAEASLKLGPILVTAIGHAQDVTLLHQIADKRFTTPTALGTHLKEMVKDVREEMAHSKAKLIADLEKSHGNRLKTARTLWIAVSLVLLVVGFVLGVMLSGLL